VVEINMAERATELKLNILEPYKSPTIKGSLFQLFNSAISFFVLWFVMLLSLEYSYWLTLLLAVPTSGMLIRLFIIQHDCGHGSFFKSRKANDSVGRWLGLLTITPYGYWRKMHAIHHATNGDMDRRGTGDVKTLTVKEYIALPRRHRFGYRLYRNPLILFVFGPIFLFILKHRFPFDLPASWKREWSSVLWTNVGILALGGVMSFLVGFKALLMIQLPISLLAGMAGVWLFYVQHQFESTYWERGKQWDFHTAGLKGSSYYELTPVLRWFTGNIGIHHIHHLSSAIPNYRLIKCYRENPEMQQVTRIGLWKSWKCARLKLWDEEAKQLVGYREMVAIRDGSPLAS
jgi:omega-6 fatty acid desaturase (delta-12 desaturase)